MGRTYSSLPQNEDMLKLSLALCLVMVAMASAASEPRFRKLVKEEEVKLGCSAGEIAACVGEVTAAIAACTNPATIVTCVEDILGASDCFTCLCDVIGFLGIDFPGC